MAIADDRVTTALSAVATVMRGARDPWWVIGSAAVALHGVVTDVADIDLLASAADAMDVVTRLGLAVDQRDPHPLFRSRIFAQWPRADRIVEIMGGLAIDERGIWQTVIPTTRVILGGVYVPDRADLMQILSRFGRAKDLERRRLLAAL
ncbi:hypothetical protein GCM10009102_27870 [Sphingomonas insulae]|uniref:Nucleotidyltransferase family protein n=2 Tax=Sphingomonas insulae TaxID=424800 RepID=A0ABN1HYT4_9SPHN